MELVHCPACGCSVQVADAVLGKSIRCFGCRRTFVATASLASPSPPPSPRVEEGKSGGYDDLAEEEHGPYCPGCGRRISWRDLNCPYCGEELEPDDERRFRMAGLPDRRDCEPHRGALIQSLGNVSLTVGGLSLCMFGSGALISVPLGILVWVMATRDLDRMRDGRMDPRGQAQTETGRTGGIVGIILGLIFASFFAFVWLAR
jgi:hypothetical protein